MNPIFCFAFALFCVGRLIDLALVSGISTIKAGEQLNFIHFLVSDGGNFTLGFFTIPTTRYSYLGIWFTDDDQQRQVWVANPNTPISDKSGLLTIDTFGILKITSTGGTVLNISDQVTSNPTAKLEDSGNFVLSDESGKTLWQSFDHPVNALLPGMKLGFNTATGKNWSLTSWLSDSMPASGAFTLSWEPNQDSGQLVIHRRGNPYWASGLLINQSFAFLYTTDVYNLSSTNTGDEKYFSFSASHGNSSLLSMWLFTPNGAIEGAGINGGHFFNFPFANGFCYGYEAGFGLCYGYEVEFGCVASQLPQCRSSKDTFQKMTVSFEPSVATSEYDNNTSLSLSDCMERCWKNCSCVGYQVLNSYGTGCLTYYAEKLGNYHQGGVDTMPIFVLAPSNLSLGPSPSNLSKRKRWIWVVIAVVISLLVPTVGAFYYQRMRKHRLKGEEKKTRGELIPSDSFNNANDVEDDKREGHHDLKMLSFASIVEATNNFSQEKKLGQGGFGPVYKVSTKWIDAGALTEVQNTSSTSTNIQMRSSSCTV